MVRKIRKSKGDIIFDSLNIFLLTVFMLITIYPLIYIVSASFSDPEQVYMGNIVLLPKGFSLVAYQRVFENERILNGYLNTLIYTVSGTIISLLLTFLAAYPLSRKDLRGKNFFMAFFVITMFFSGGIVPLYIVVNALYLTDTIFGVILPGCLGVWNVIIVRTYINTAIPYELQEAAMVDGMSGARIFAQIIIPLCKPIVAVMALFYLVGYWNSFFNALIFLSDASKYPLQMVLRDILIVNDMGNMGGSGSVQDNTHEQMLLAESLKYSSIVVSTLPILFIYPFLSKYFEKGLVVGSVKG